MTGSPFARDLERALQGLGVPMDDAVVFGSTVMKLHGMKDEIGDVDLFVSQRAYARLRSQAGRRGVALWWELRPAEDDPPFLEGIGGPVLGKLYPIHAFHAWTSRDPWLDVPDAMATAVRVSGLLCVRLELVAKWKRQALTWCEEHDVQVEGSPWEKHVNDLLILQDAGVVA